ncbi:MAG: hypothetical protein ACR2LV_09080 [Solirubrobacteraceae bacterium]
MTVPSDRLVWFAVLGGGLGWAAQFVASLAFGWAQCNSPADRFGLPVHAWDVVLSGTGVVVALLAEATSLRLFRATRKPKGENALSLGRVHFLSVIGLTVNPLALAIILMSGVGVQLFPLCHQV